MNALQAVVTNREINKRTQRHLYAIIGIPCKFVPKFVPKLLIIGYSIW